MIGLFIDFSKPFDTICHNILLRIRGTANAWFRNYLANRKQYVMYNNSSELGNSKFGVPHGSIIVPLLFLIYVNDPCNVSQVVQFILFADDTNIFVSVDNLTYQFDTLNKELVIINQWIQSNKLSLNIEKTNILTRKYLINKLNYTLTVIPFHALLISWSDYK